MFTTIGISAYQLHNTIDYLVLDILSLPGFINCSGSEHELSEVSLTNKIFKMLLEGTTPNSVVHPALMIGTILLRSKTGWIMLEWLGALYPGLVLDGTEDLVNRKLQWGEVGIHPENLELALRGVWIHQLVVVVPPAMFLSLV